MREANLMTLNKGSMSQLSEGKKEILCFISHPQQRLGSMLHKILDDLSFIPGTKWCVG